MSYPRFSFGHLADRLHSGAKASAIVAQVAKGFFPEGLDGHQSFLFLLFNAQGEYIGFTRMSLDSPEHYASKLFEHLSSRDAAFSIVARNSPDGSLDFSEFDLEHHEFLTYACSCAGVEVADYLILSASGYYSLTDYEMREGL
jgi:DNA repair protein RadC